MPTFEQGKTYNGYYNKLLFIFEVTEIHPTGYMYLDVLYTSNEGLLTLGKDGTHQNSAFIRYGDWKESPSVDFTHAIVDLSLALRNEDLFKHFNKTEKGIVT